MQKIIDKEALDELIEECEITSIGDAYIDLICPKKYIKKFINGLSELGVKITGFTWWCNVENEHNPCGMGGPMNKYGENWYSEIEMGNVVILKNNEEYLKYLLKDWEKSCNYKKCYIPGFWLDVPDNWKL